MWLRKIVRLDCWEFEESQVLAPLAHVVPGITKTGRPRAGGKGRRRLHLSPCMLAVGLARSGATLAPNEPVGFWRAQAAFARVQEACIEFRGELRATPDPLHLLRDSTRTGLAGELGQAITWLFAVCELKLPHIMDFGRACSQVLNIPSPGANDTRPDYLAASRNAAVILESKGMIHLHTDNTQWKPSLRTGLLQTNAGSDWISRHGCSIPVSNEYAVAFALVEKDRSEVAFVDPQIHDGSLSNRHAQRFMRGHIAAWAASSGLMPLAVLLNALGDDRLMFDHGMDERSVAGRRMYASPRRLPVNEDYSMESLIDADLLDATLAGDGERALEAIRGFQRGLRGVGPRSMQVWREFPNFVALPDGTFYHLRPNVALRESDLDPSAPELIVPPLGG